MMRTEHKRSITEYPLNRNRIKGRIEMMRPIFLRFSRTYVLSYGLLNNTFDDQDRFYTSTTTYYDENKEITRVTHEYYTYNENGERETHEELPSEPNE